jgi:hypothetical protein
MPNLGPKVYDWTEAFLAAVREYPTIAHGARAAGVSYTTAWKRTKEDEAFGEAVRLAMEEGIDRAEQEAFRRGVVGFEEPVVYQGQITYHIERDGHGNPVLSKEGIPKLLLDDHGRPVPVTIRKHSDAMLGLVLKARRKSYGTERTELTGADGGPVQAQQIVIATGVPQRPDADFSDLA